MKTSSFKQDQYLTKHFISQEAGVLNESNELGSRHNSEEDGWVSPHKSCKDTLIF